MLSHTPNIHVSLTVCFVVFFQLLVKRKGKNKYIGNFKFLHSWSSTVDCKTAPSFPRSPKSGVFDPFLARSREMGERSEEGVARPEGKGNRERGATPFSRRSPISRPRVKIRSKTQAQTTFGLHSTASLHLTDTWSMEKKS